MVSPLHQFSLTELILGAIFIIGLLAAVQRWALQRLNADPSDDMDDANADKESEILGDVPVRSKVGTPRPRRLQPLTSGREEPAMGSPLAKAEPSLVAAGAAFVAKQTGSKSAEPADKGLDLPPLSPADAVSVGGAAKKPEPMPAFTDKPASPVTLPPLSVDLPPLTPADAKKDLPLVGASAGAPAETDDVKKRKTPLTNPVAEPGRSGLILTPKNAEAPAEPVTAEASKLVVPPIEPAKAPEAPAVAAKKEDTPVSKPAEPVAPVTSKPEAKPETPAKTGWRPRIFLPANLPAAAKPAEEPKPAPVPATPATPVEAKAPTVPISESKAETKPEPTAVPVPTLPAAKPAESVTAKAETAEPTPKEPAKTVPPVPVIKAEEAKPADPKTAPAQSVPASEVKATVPAADDRSKTPTPAPKVPAAPVTVDKAPAKPTESPTPVPVPILPSKPAPVAASAPTGVPVSTPQSTMAQPESTTNVPANTRASAQLTLGFEITSLQLTPFFKLGAVQLKPLSNVVGLHLIASQSADNPLAAGISFQIDTVELNEASHVRSILLKPLQGGAQPATVPQSKLQVDAIQIGQGGDGAPISVTSSAGTSTAVQLLATFTIAAMDFTPAFEIGSLRLEPTSNSVLLRLAPSSRPASLDLPPSFEVANVQLGENAQISGMRVTPGTKAD